MTWRIKNWKQFQHFKDRRPPWIKLYRDLLDDPDWHALDNEAAKILTMLWLIASENDGQLPDLKKLSFRLRVDQETLSQIIPRLSHWLIQDDINLISDRYHDDAPETETETETEEDRAVVVSRETSQASPAESPNGLTTKYEFESGVIKLTKKDFEKWREAFPNLDLKAELLSLTEWAGQQPKWFHPVSAALAKRNREQKLRLEVAKSPKPEQKWRSGIEGVV